MTFWLEYERSRCLHESRHDLLEDWVVTMPQLSTREGRWEVGCIQKYETREGKVRWRSLNLKRQTFRSGYMKREECAQEMVALCPDVAQAIGWRRAKIIHLPIDDLSTEARNARLNVHG